MRTEAKARLATPADGYRAPSAGELFFDGQPFKGPGGPVAVRPRTSAGAISPGFKL